MPQKLKETNKKSKRRGNNEGAIYQRSKDKRWEGAVIIGYKTDGKPIRKYIYGHSRQEVAAKVSQMTSEVFSKGYISVSARDERNFKVLMTEWFDTFFAPNYTGITQETCHYMMKNIFKAFGTIDVQKISLESLQRFFNGKIKEGLSSSSISKMRNLLNKFFVYATKKGYVQENPMAEVVIRKLEDDDVSKGKEKALRPEIRTKVFKSVTGNPILKPIVTIFSFTGMRPQELIALEWSHVNLDDRTIYVKQASKRIVEFDEAGNVVFRGTRIGKTKTPKSVRAFIMPDIVVEVLETWREHCKANGINSKFVFPNTKNGEMRTYSGLRSLLRRFIEKHQLEDEHISLYTFRHTFATILLEERENPRIVADLMGHVKVGTTLNIYSQVVSNMVYEQTAQTLNGVYSKMPI